MIHPAAIFSPFHRMKIAAIGALGLTVATVGAALALPKVSIWNATASVPRGLYWIAHDRRPTKGQLAILWLPRDAATLADQRHYLPRDVPLIKPVAAAPGQQVCRANRDISIDGHVVALALANDSVGRSLPVWSGCFSVASDRLFVLNPAVPTSFDGRYFGPVDSSKLIGRAVPVVTEDPVTHQYRWQLFIRKS